MVSWIDRVYIVYFAVHIVTTLLIDAAIAIPKAWQLPVQQQLLEFHVRQNNDLLIIQSPVWLQAFVWIELALQTPFFVWGIVDLSRGRKRVWPAAVAYGVEASTTTFACLAEVLFMEAPWPIKQNLLGLYFPTFVLPLVMAVDFSIRITREITAKPKQE